MSRLEKIVPPQKLCKQIPQGEFDCCALCWAVSDGGAGVELRKDFERLITDCPDEIMFIDCPAPTVEEILAEIAIQSGTYSSVSVWTDGNAESSYLDYEQDVSRTSDTYESASEAALRQWFKIKNIGVNNE